MENWDDTPDEAPVYTATREEEFLFTWRVERARTAIIRWNEKHPPNERADEFIIDLISKGVAYDEVSPTEFDKLVVELDCNPGLALQILG